MTNDNHHGYVEIGAGILVSHKELCNVRYRYVENWRTLHIYRNDYPNYHCDSVVEGLLTPGDMFLEYRDGENFIKNDIEINKIAEFFQGQDTVLVHCAAGQTRSPTVAIVGLVVRGVPLNRAIGDMIVENYKQRGIVSNLCLTPIRETVEWADGRGSL